MCINVFDFTLQGPLFLGGAINLPRQIFTPKNTQVCKDDQISSKHTFFHALSASEEGVLGHDLLVICRQ